MVVVMGRWGVLAILLASASPALAGAPLVNLVDGKLLLPPPETPLHPFTLTYSDKAARKAVERDLLARVEAEPIQIQAIDPANRTVRLRTTLWGRDLLRQGGLTISGTEADATRRDCVDVFVEFTATMTTRLREPLDPRAGAVCPDGAILDPERHVVVEGLDRRGRRLYAVKADDSRWSIQETVGADGRLQLLRAGRQVEAPNYVRFQAPDVGGRLHRLQIWQFSDRGRGAVIGRIILEGGR